MPHRWTPIALLLLASAALPARAQLLPALGGQRAGTSGFQFLKIPVDARSAALGQTAVTSAGDVSVLYWNPALAAYSPGLQAGLYHSAYFVDVTLDYAGVIWPVPGTNMAVGASVQTLNSGEMDVTTEFQPFGTGETFRLLDLAVGLTFSQRLTDLFSYGVTTKLVRESVAGLSATTAVVDLGFHYAVGSTGLEMAVALRNFGLDGRPEGSLSRPVIGDPPREVESTFESMTPPTTFHLGASWEALRADPNQSLRVSTQLDNPSDNAETWSAGVEYGWRGTLFLRTGYRFGIEEFTTPSAGAGVQVPMSGARLRFDYGFNRLERLGAVHRVGLNITL
jgi:opacity protein-like surface antigen